MTVRIVSCLQHRLHNARQNVPRWSRWLVVVIAIGLTLGTWIYLPLQAIGWDLPRWEAFIFETCDPFCHQIAARSFHVAGHVFPLCARCTGMWLGITLGVAFAMVRVLRHRWWIGTGMAVLATAASAFDFLREESGGTPSALARSLLGFLLFIGVTIAVSFDTLAVLAGLARFVRRLCQGRL